MTAPVGIIGGGWAGLAAGVELAAAGCPVALYEAAPQLGGRARSVDWDGLEVDNGQHLMIGGYRDTLALMDRVGTRQLQEQRPLDLRLPGFRLHLPPLPAPVHLAAGLLLARGLSPTDRLAAIRFMAALRQCRFRLEADQTVQALLARHRQPPGLVERLWSPLCVAALNTPMERASAQVFCHVLRDSLAGPREASDLLFNRAGLGRCFPEAAAAFIRQRGGQIHTRTRIDHVLTDGTDFRLTISGHATPAAPCRRLVLAVHPTRVAGLVAQLPELEPHLAPLKTLEWEPILTLWLRFAAPVALPFPMHGLGPGQAPWVFDRHDIAPGLLAIVVSAQGPHLDLAPEDFLAECLDRLAAITGPLPPLTAWKRILEHRATFACTPNLTRPGNATPLPGLDLAGDYTAGDYPATLEGAVRSGVQCARLILDSL